MRRLAAVSLLAIATSPALAQSADPVPQGAPNAPQFEPAFPEQTRAPAETTEVELEVATIAGGLVHPWGIAILPDDAGWLVSERSGDLRHISASGDVSEPLSGVPEVFNVEQGGLLDVKLGPDFASDRTIFITYSKPAGGDRSVTAAARGTLSEDLTSLSDVTDIFVQEPPSPSPMHYGSRIVFDGNGHAFITTGEHFTETERQNAQDLATTYGKIVRVALDGSTPDDNPFVGQDGAIGTIWSYGHRNIQGAAFRDGTLWTIEHGPKGGDELNRTEAGLNYGWPLIAYGINYDDTPVGTGEAAQEGLEQPTYYWDPVIAPGDMVFYEGDMFEDWQGDALIASLRPGGIVRLELDEEGLVAAEERLMTELGRIRDIDVMPDGSLVVVTDREDGELLRLSAAPPS